MSTSRIKRLTRDGAERETRYRASGVSLRAITPSGCIPKRLLTTFFVRASHIITALSGPASPVTSHLRLRLALVEVMVFTFRLKEETRPFYEELYCIYLIQKNIIVGSKVIM